MYKSLNNRKKAYNTILLINIKVIEFMWQFDRKNNKFKIVIKIKKIIILIE